MHAAGTSGVHTSLGDSVTWLSVTNGASTHNEDLADELLKPPEQRDPAIVNQTQEQYAAMKEQELRTAAALFGVTDVRVMPFLDRPFRLKDHPEAIEMLRDIILETRPDVLIPGYPHLSRHHRLNTGLPDDHNEAAYAALEARAAAHIPRYGTGEQPHKIAATYYPGVYYEKDQYDFIVDVSDWFEQLVEAELMFKSQGHTPAYARRRIEVELGQVGWFAGTLYGEPFLCERPALLSKITVPASMLRQAREGPKKHIARISGQLPDNT